MKYDINGLLERQIKFEVPHIKWIAHQLLKAVEYLHSVDIMHRDIKGANILLDDEGTLKLADFGLSKKYDQFRKIYTNRVVTLWYRAPELLLGSYQYNKSIDIWSVGWFIAELYMGRPLFPGNIEADQIELIFKAWGTPTYETWPNLTYLNTFAELKPKQYPDKLTEYLQKEGDYPTKIDDQAISLIRGMLTMCPEMRMKVSDCLSHTYFTTSPLPCSKSLLPLTEGEAHEHALKEERKEIRRQLANEEAMKEAMIYPTTQDSAAKFGHHRRKYRNPRGGYSGRKRDSTNR
jgi:serine/threonine protein kinase